eukprot:gene9251-14335_t
MPVLYVLSVAAWASVSFDRHVQDHMVLQREPETASVYGKYSGTAATIHVTVHDGFASYDIPATAAEGTWTAQLRPTPAGGNYTITATCSGCGNSSTAAIADVTFGDVWYCSGQSNMALPLMYTFSRNKSIE